MIPNFFFNDRAFEYSFGDAHPLKPERLRRMFLLLDRYAEDYKLASDPALPSDLIRVHKPEYVEATRKISDEISDSDNEQLNDLRTEFGFWGDNPAFPGMFEAAIACTGTSVAAAAAVRDGAPLGFGIAGGWHHALAARASGFCIFNDPAVACAILRDRFPKVAYVDIDVHHGDGVQWIFYEDPTVLTCSIHEDPASLWPGTGSTDETGAKFSSLNVPIPAGTNGEIWLESFKRTVLMALEAWKPDAIVLQIGADTHFLDPLAHIQSDQQSWLSAVMAIQALDLPLVVLGGGGYNLTTVPRMWASAVLSLSGIPFENRIPDEIAMQVGAKTFADERNPYAADNSQKDRAEAVVERLQHDFLPHLKGN